METLGKQFKFDDIEAKPNNDHSLLPFRAPFKRIHEIFESPETSPRSEKKGISNSLEIILMIDMFLIILEIIDLTPKIPLTPLTPEIIGIYSL